MTNETKNESKQNDNTKKDAEGEIQGSGSKVVDAHDAKTTVKSEEDPHAQSEEKSHNKAQDKQEDRPPQEPSDESGHETAKGSKESPSDENEPTPRKGDILIEVTDLTKIYGDFAAVDKISFQVRRGEVVGFLGPNGAGKTTTMRMLTCLLAPTRGRAKVAGFDTLTQSMDVRRSIGYLPEDTPLYENMSVLEFLRFAAEARDVPKAERNARIREVCEVAGLNSVLGRAIGHLSKGYRQRVGLAQAMVHDPPILILDEPWTGLDPNQIADVRSLIKKLGENKTLLLSTHILAEVEAVCDRIIIIDRGTIKADGAPQDIVRKFGHVTYRLRIKGGKNIDAFEAEIKSNGTVASVDMDTSGEQTTLDILCRKGKDLNQEAVLDAARKAGLVVASLERSASNLEDVFRSLTVGDRVEIGKAA